MDAPRSQRPSWGTVITGGATGTDVAGNLRQHAEAARGAYASNTERALRADIVVFTAWCDSASRHPLPASPETVATFIDAMNGAKAPATIRQGTRPVSPPSTTPPACRTPSIPRSSSWPSNGCTARTGGHSSRRHR